MQALFVLCLVAGLAGTALLALVGGAAGHLGGAAHLPAGHTGLHVGAAHASATLPGGHVAPALHAHAGDGIGAHGPASVTHGHVPGGTPSAGHANAVAETAPGSALIAAAGWSLSWLSPLTLAAGVMWFGAGGLLGGLVAPALAVVVAFVAALLGAGIVRTVMSAFARASSAPLAADPIGAIGTLNARIQPGMLGEVGYDLEGLHRTAPARAEEQASLPRGTNVVIVGYERGVARVRTLDPLSAVPSRIPRPCWKQVKDPRNTRCGHAARYAAAASGKGRSA